MAGSDPDNVLKPRLHPQQLSGQLGQSSRPGSVPGQRSHPSPRLWFCPLQESKTKH